MHEKLPEMNSNLAQQYDYLRSILPNPLPHPHCLIVSRELAKLPKLKLRLILTQVASFKDFNSENDPYGEHDYGLFKYEDFEVVWKFDFLSSKRQFILTITTPDEY